MICERRKTRYVSNLGDVGRRYFVDGGVPGADGGDLAGLERMTPNGVQHRVGALMARVVR